MSSHRSPWKLLACVALAACRSPYDVPPSQARLWLDYPPGAEADIANINPGISVVISAQVLSADREPVQGVEVIWDDLFNPAGAQPARSLSDAQGMVYATWTMRPLNNGVFSARQTIKAYVHGADHSPIEYRALVVKCTRCP